MYDANAKAAERRAILKEYLVANGCVDCGYNANADALEFDHLPHYEKSKNVMGMTYNSWGAIWLEVAKCEVVCCNCHAIRTKQRYYA